MAKEIKEISHLPPDEWERILSQFEKHDCTVVIGGIPFLIPKAVHGFIKDLLLQISSLENEISED